MGCDFSNLVKQEFQESVSKINQEVQKISDLEIHLKSMISTFNEFTTEEVDASVLSTRLSQNITNLELIAKEMQKIKNCKTTDTIMNNLNEKTILEECSSQKKESHENKDFLNQVKDPLSLKPRNSPFQASDHNSILLDPEIAALINKNRIRLLRKQTT